MIETIIDLGYLFGTVLFVLGLRQLSSPDTARRGNLYAATGMGVGILSAFFDPSVSDGGGNYLWIVGGMIFGGVIGWLTAKKIQMTAMPQMVSVFNGLGGACAVVLSVVELYTGNLDMGEKVISLFALFIGSVAFSGSMLAYLKLDGKLKDSQVTWPKHSIINQVLLVATIALFIYVAISAQSPTLIIAFLLLTLFYGWSFVAPIGGADMPVVISLLNSFTGLSAAAAGLIYDNQLMIVGGILVGASGTILTVLMCQAMNRSLFNVLIGGFSAGGAAAESGDQVAKSTNPVDTSILLYYSQSVMFVPGYGLAVAQAQKVLKELDDLLEANGVDVKYAIHPVAGRMPGHMNVLLAEADVPYPKLLDLDDANAALSNTDVVVIVGANDVVNPAAVDDPGSSIYGMPVLNVWNAKHVVVLKRSMSPGYAGIQNQLFFHEKTKMLFGDAKDSIQKVVSEVKNQ